MKLSQKLGAFCALVTALPLLLISLFALSAFSSYSHSQASEQVKKEARAAAGLYEKRLEELRVAAAQLAADIANKALVNSEAGSAESGSAWARLQDMLPRAQNDFNLDFLIVADPSGRVIARQNDKPASNELIASAAAAGGKSLLAERVITEGIQLRHTVQAAAAVEEGETLKRLGLEHLAQVRLAGEVRSDRALVLEACAPIFSAGRFVGVALIGQVLNNYSEGRVGANSLQTPLVAQARRLLYGSGETPSGVLIALGNVVIASSLPAPVAGEKPVLLGVTRQAEQAEEVLTENAATYLVVWQPIKTADGATVGAIGAALDEAAIASPGAALRLTLFGVSLLATLLAGAAGFFIGHKFATRVSTLTEAASRMSLGELSAPIRDDAFSEERRFGEFFLDEINQLTYQLDEMRESFRQAIERLRKR